MSSHADYSNLVQAGRVHGSLYTDQAVFDAELEAIFYNSWVFVGHASEIPNKGDYVRRQVGRQPVLLVRDGDGGLQVLINRCPHRGNLLCWRDKGNTRGSITCAYHAWTFGLKGNLMGVPYAQGLEQDKHNIRLGRAAAVEEYRGFVFASLAEPRVGFSDYLGNGKALIDRTCDLSPLGTVAVGAGWLRHRLDANWKMIADNNTDGYHVAFVHASFLASLQSQYETAVAPKESEVLGVTRDWGGGHNELDFAPTYRRSLDWLGGKAERFPKYIQAMNDRYGTEKAEQLLFQGPSHATIFPNLFLGELNVQIIEPTATGEVVLHITPLLLDGAPEVNSRSLQQTPGAFGPGGFLFADDAATAERNQLGLAARSPEWVDLSRGMSREQRVNGHTEGHFTDELTARAFWGQYRHLMAGTDR